jgi:hypothetical protein
MPTRLLIALAGLLVPLGLWAQAGNSGASLSGGGVPYGGGQAPSLNYAGQGAPSNTLFVSLSSQTTYDDNALPTLGPRIGDVTYSLGPHFAFVHAAGDVTAALDYQPYFEFYQRLTQYDRVNQSFSADLSYKVGARLTFRLRDSFLDQTGAYQPQPGTNFVAGLGGPTQLNATV